MIRVISVTRTDQKSSRSRFSPGQSNDAPVRALVNNLLLALAFALCLSACGGSGSNGAASPQTAQVGNTAAAVDIPRFMAWWGTAGLRRQPSNEHPEAQDSVMRLDGQGIYEQGTSWLEEDWTIAGVGGDSFATWRRPTDVSEAKTQIRNYSVSDIHRQEGVPGFSVARPLSSRVVNGFWYSTATLSHGGTYLAGAWAASSQSFAEQRLLAIVDLAAPEPTAQNVFIPPGGETEKVDAIQWINDAQFIVRNQSGRKFLWTVGSPQFLELKAPPPSFNGYAFVSEFYAPDGLKYGGLMSKDGGRTHEVWTSNPDYTDMRQITNAGLGLNNFKWIGNSKAIKVHFAANTNAGIDNRCTNAMLSPEAESMLSAQQMAASPSLENLPCDFSASLLK